MNPSLFNNCSSIPSISHHHQTKIQRKQTCNKAILRLFSVRKGCWNEKHRGKKYRGKNSELRFSAVKTQNSAAGVEISRAAEKLWALIIAVANILSRISISILQQIPLP